MNLSEALEKVRIRYKSIYPNYQLHDKNPYILIIDDNYPPKKGDGVLAFNLHYLENLSIKKRNALISKIQNFDNTVINAKDIVLGVHKFLIKRFSKKDNERINKKLKNIVLFPSDKDTKIKRYKEIIRKFPELKATIRHYKKVNLNKIKYKKPSKKLKVKRIK